MATWHYKNESGLTTTLSFPNPRAGLDLVLADGRAVTFNATRSDGMRVSRGVPATIVYGKVREIAYRGDAHLPPFFAHWGRTEVEPDNLLFGDGELNRPFAELL